MTKIALITASVQRALSSKELEVYVSRTDGLMSRLVGFFPSLLDRLYPTLERMGQSGMRRYKKTM